MYLKLILKKIETYFYIARNAPIGILIDTAIIKAEIVTFRERLIISNKSLFKEIIKLNAVSRILISIFF